MMTSIMNSKLFKKSIALFSAIGCFAVLTFGASAQTSTSNVKQTNSQDLHLGSGYCSAESIYHTGTAMPYDDADVTSKIGCKAYCHLRIDDMLHTPGTSTTNKYKYQGSKNMFDGVAQNDCVTPGADTGTGHCESVRYADSDTNFTNITYRTYISIYF